MPGGKNITDQQEEQAYEDPIRYLIPYHNDKPCYEE
jgi:hypothetical protein